MSDFDALVAAVRACTACTQVVHSHVLGAGNGSVRASIMFVGEAPGRLGAGRTGVPFHGDESGRRFESFLQIAGLTRADVFVTNAILCNPIDLRSNNRRPLMSEMRRCLPFLRAQVQAMDPKVVIALGDVALRSLALIDGHGANLRGECGRPLSWFGRTLMPLYHPGRQSTLHRPETAQKGDWLGLGNYLGTRLDYSISKERPMPLSGAAGVRQAMK